MIAGSGPDRPVHDSRFPKPTSRNKKIIIWNMNSSDATYYGFLPTSEKQKASLYIKKPLILPSFVSHWPWQWISSLSDESRINSNSRDEICANLSCVKRRRERRKKFAQPKNPLSRLRNRFSVPSFHFPHKDGSVLSVLSSANWERSLKRTPLSACVGKRCMCAK